MQSFFSSAPLPSGGAHVAPAQPRVPGPAIVPRPVEPKRPRNAWGILLILVAVAGGAAWYWNAKSDVKTPGTPILTVPVGAIVTGDLAETVRVAGTVTADKFASIMGPRIQGNRNNYNRGGQGGVGGNDFNLIITKLATPGSRVRAGDTVAEFDKTNQATRVDDYKDTVIQADANINKMKASLAATMEAHDQSVRSAKADYDKAQLDLQTVPIRSTIDAEKYKLAVEENKAKYEELVSESPLVEESQRAAIRVSELDRQQSNIELERAQKNVEIMSLKTPIAGIVVMQSIFRGGDFGQVREGDQVAAGQPFMSIVDPSSMVVNATVNQVDAEKLRLGQKATVRLDAYPDLQLPGTVVGIGALSKTSTFRASYVSEIPVRIKLDKIDPRVIPDLTASAEIVVNGQADALIAPRSAVFEENGGRFVFVQGPEGWLRKKVEVGSANNLFVEIRTGLQKGDKVALQRPI